MMELVQEAQKQKSAAQRVDAARNPGGVFVDGIHRRWVEGRIGAPAHLAQTMDQIIAALFTVHRAQMIGGNDALPELLKISAREHAAKLRLSDQEGLEGRNIVDLKIRQHTKLFQGAHRQILRFVDDQKGAAAMFVCRFEESLQPKQKGALITRELLQ